MRDSPARIRNDQVTGDDFPAALVPAPYRRVLGLGYIEGDAFPIPAWTGTQTKAPTVQDGGAFHFTLRRFRRPSDGR